MSYLYVNLVGSARATLVAVLTLGLLVLSAPPRASTAQEATPASTQPTASQPAADKADAKPAEPKPAEAKPTEPKAADAKPADAKPADPKPADTKPADERPAATKVDMRLDELERRLKDLIGEINSLRSPMPKTAGTGTGKPSDKPTEKSADKPSDKPAEKTADKAADKSASKPSDKPAEKTTEKPSEKPVEKPTEPKIELPDSWLAQLPWRPIGPANMGGRIVALSVCPTDPSMFWVATASGGLLKTTNNGISFEHQFDRQSTVSIGAVAVAPSDSKIVWVGTGENNPRNSVSYGDGVYKSVDGGKTWKRMGLEKTYQIGHIVVHPTDPNIVYVGALGRLYGANPERGIYKTTNGGESWERVLFVDDKTGVIDFRMHPTQPDTLIVATWERLRDGFDSWPGRDVPIPDGYDGYDPIKKWGPGSGLWKTTDGGKSWKRLTAGLPTGQLGRIGLDWYVKDPNILYAVIDCENIGKGPEPIPVYIGVVGENSGGVPHAAIVMPDSPAAKAGIVAGDVFVSIGDMNLLDFDQLLEQLRRKRVGEKVAIKIKRGDEVKEVSVTLAGRPGQQQGGPGGAGGGASGGGPTTGIWFGMFTERRDDQFIVTRVMPDGPAAKAGVQDGDQLISAGDKKLDDASSLTASIANAKAGDKLKLTVKRGTEEKQLEVTLEERPLQARFAGGGGGGGGTGRRGGNTAESGASDVYLGIQGETAEGGVKLNEITDDGPADKAKLLAGDLVTEVDGRAIATYEALVEEIRRRRPGDVLRLTIRRDDQPQQIAVTVERRAGAARTRPYSPSLAGQSANVQDLQGAKGAEFGGIYKSVDGGETWRRVNSLNDRPMYFSQVRVDPNDEKKVYALGVAQFRSSDGGLTFSDDFGRSVHADGHALWIDPRDGRHMVMGVDGGVYTTYDRGSTWDHLNLTDIAQFYHVAITGKAPYQVVGGLQDNGSWLGPSLSQTAAGPINEDWVSVGGGDGFMCRVDAEDPDLIYFESQNGAMARRNLRTGEAASIRPRRVQGATNYRFNWNTPFILSNHNPRLFYAAGNYVFRSLNRGDDLHVISPEITLTKRGSATALAESPRDADVLYVGTDDGALWMTRDGGRKWTDITRNLGLPSPRWISTIEASRHSAGRVYVACDGHRADDDEPYLFVSEDYGQTWRSLRANLPIGSTRCLREDPISPNLLLLGTEFGAWCSVDRGQHWNRMSNTGKLPTVAVHEFAFHPASGEVAVATHGRSIWICDITVLRQVKAEHLANKPALYDPATVVRWQALPRRGGTNRRFIGANPENGAQLYYALPAPAKQSSLKIVDIEGKTVRELRAPLEAGLHKVGWDLSRAPEGRAGQGGGAGGPGGGRGFGGRGGNPGGSPGGAAEKPGDEKPSQEKPGEKPSEKPAVKPDVKPEEKASEKAGEKPSEKPSEKPAEKPSEKPGSTPTSGTSTEGRRAGGQGGGFGGGFGGRGAAVPAGVYRVVLTVDGQELSTLVRVQLDPNLPAGVTRVEFLDERRELTPEEEEEEEERRERGEMEEDEEDDD